MRKVNKLIRNNIIEINKKANCPCEFKILTPKEYKKELRKKLKEETNELLNSKKKDQAYELADVLEVIYAWAKAEGIDKKTLEKLELKKEKYGEVLVKKYI